MEHRNNNNNNNDNNNNNNYYYMYLEKWEEEDLPALKTALTHPYIDSKTKHKNTKTHYSHQT